MGGQSKTTEAYRQAYDNKNLSTMKAQGWGEDTVRGQLPVLEQMQGKAANEYLNAIGLNPQQQQTWQNTMGAVNQWGAAGPGGYAAQRYLQPVLEGGYGQYVDQASMDKQRQLMANALPSEQALFAEEAAKQLGPYRHGGEAAAFGSGYGKLLLDQASRQGELESSIGGRIEQAKQLYGQQAPAVAQQAATLMDPTGWGKAALEMGGTPEAYRQQQEANALNQANPLASLLQGYSQMAYLFPESTTSQDTGITQGRGTTASKEGGCSMCYLFTEADLLLTDVRTVRDDRYSKDGIISRGYSGMSAWLVPKMAKYKAVKWIVKKLMLTPLATFAILDCKKKKTALDYTKIVLLIPYCTFWCNVVWGVLGLMTLPQYSWEKYATRLD